MIDDSLIVSIHVPKTAGVSFHFALKRHFGSRLLRDYDGRPLLRMTENEARRAPGSFLGPGEAAALAQSYDVVHGHFFASKYLALGAAARFAVFLRDPVERTISQYRHWRREPDNRRHPLARSIAAGELDLVTFSRQPEMRAVYPRYLGGVPLEAFAFIGLTESYDRSLALFEAMFGAKLEALRKNVAKPDREAAVTRRERAQISAAQAVNAAIYRHAERRFEALCERYL